MTKRAVRGRVLSGGENQKSSESLFERLTLLKAVANEWVADFERVKILNANPAINPRLFADGHVLAMQEKKFQEIVRLASQNKNFASYKISDLVQEILHTWNDPKIQSELNARTLSERKKILPLATAAYRRRQDTLRQQIFDRAKSGLSKKVVNPEKDDEMECPENSHPIAGDQIDTKSDSLSFFALNNDKFLEAESNAPKELLSSYKTSEENPLPTAESVSIPAIEQSSMIIRDSVHCLRQNNLGLVKGIATQELIKKSIPVENIDMGELIDHGFYGLMKAIRDFDLTRLAELSNYIKAMIRGAIDDRLKIEDPVPKKLRKEAAKLAKLEGMTGNNSASELLRRKHLNEMKLIQCALNPLREHKDIKQGKAVLLIVKAILGKRLNQETEIKSILKPEDRRIICLSISIAIEANLIKCNQKETSSSNIAGRMLSYCLRDLKRSKNQ